MQRMNEVMARRLQQAEAAAQQAMEQAQQVGLQGCVQMQARQWPSDCVHAVKMLKQCSRHFPLVDVPSSCHCSRPKCLPLAARKPAQARRAMDEYVNLGAPLEGPVKLSPSSSIAGGAALIWCRDVAWM
jgi:hypothetical protein